MKRMLPALAIALSLTLLCGCAPSSVTDAQPEIRSVGDVVYSSHDEAISRVLEEYNSKRTAPRAAKESSSHNEDPSAPLNVMGHASPVNSGYVVYPQVQDVAAADAINSEICRQVQLRAEELGVPVFTEYRVEYNRNGLFSIRIFLYDLYGNGEECLDCIPLTFDADSGELCSICDFFDGEDNRWRGSIPDMITAQAQDQDMVLLNSLLPIPDDQQFYIADGSVVIMYGLYEISVYAAGEPEFSIPVGELEEYMAAESPLKDLLPPSPSPEITAAPTPEQTPDASSQPDQTATTPPPTEAQGENAEDGEIYEAGGAPVLSESPDQQVSAETEGEIAVDPTPAPTPTPTPLPIATPPMEEVQ